MQILKKNLFETSGKIPCGTPEGFLAETPGGIPGDTPGGTLGETPGVTPRGISSGTAGPVLVGAFIIIPDESFRKVSEANLQGISVGTSGWRLGETSD